MTDKLAIKQKTKDLCITTITMSAANPIAPSASHTNIMSFIKNNVQKKVKLSYIKENNDFHFSHCFSSVLPSVKRRISLLYLWETEALHWTLCSPVTN